MVNTIMSDNLAVETRTMAKEILPDKLVAEDVNVFYDKAHVIKNISIFKMPK